MAVTAAATLMKHAEFTRRLNMCHACPHGAGGDRCAITGEPHTVTAAAQHRAPVAVVITCHNYGHFLAECVDSVLTQTRPPAEVLIVDDDSTDNTAAVAARFSGRARLIRITAHNVAAARKSGLDATTAPYVLFLDADDLLPREFLASAMDALPAKLNDVAGAYCDHQCFGLNGRLIRFPAQFHRGQLFRENFIGATTLYRRAALELVPEAFSTDENIQPGDYKLAMALAQVGFRFVKHAVPLLYRRHGATQKSDSARSSRRQAGYAAVHGLDWQPLTLFIPLSGRLWAWRRQAAFLDQQTFPHARLRLILADSSQNPVFSAEVRRWLVTCDYTDVRHMQFPAEQPGLADQDREDKAIGWRVNTACCRVYNRLRSAVDTDYAWIIEDDIIPPADALPRLIAHMASDVGAVCAPYECRYNPGQTLILDITPGPRKSRRLPWGQGVQQVTGSGFGCVLMRTELLRRHIFTPDPAGDWFDPAFWRRMPADLKLLCDWSIRCDHLKAPNLNIRRAA